MQVVLCNGRKTVVVVVVVVEVAAVVAAGGSGRSGSGIGSSSMLLQDTANITWLFVQKYGPSQ